MAPAGWKIPDSDDWESLKTYTGNEASLLKAGEWETLDKDKPVCTASNLTGFTAYPVGHWGAGKHLNKNQLVFYWTLNDANTSIPERTVCFTGSNSDFISGATLVSGETYYKAFSIRCLKE